MDWPRAKTILIIALVAVNLFLFCAYANSTMKQTRNEEQVRADVCRVLETLGYRLDANILPRDSEVYYPARVTRRTKSERTAMLQALDGNGAENSVGATRYTGKKGEVTLRSGGYFDATFDIPGAQDSDAAALAVSKLKDIRVNIISVRERTEGAVKVVDGICEVAGKPIFNCRVECRISGDNMAAAGRIPMGEISFLQNIQPCAVSGLMLNFAQHAKGIGIEGGTVQSITPGYVISSAGELEGGVTELAPVWCIRLENEDYYINALTGKAVTPE